MCCIPVFKAEDLYLTEHQSGSWTIEAQSDDGLNKMVYFSFALKSGLGGGSELLLKVHVHQELSPASCLPTALTHGSQLLLKMVP